MMNTNKQYQVRLLEQRENEWVPAPVDSEFVDTLEEAREHGQLAPVAIYAPGAAVGKDEAVEMIIPSEE